MTKFKKSQKFRIISGQACFYATKKEIDAGIGDFAAFNIAVQIATAVIEQSLAAGNPIVGVSGPYNNLAIQVNVA